MSDGQTMDINMYDIAMTNEQAIEILSNIPIPTNSDYSAQEIIMALQKGINALYGGRE